MGKRDTPFREWDILVLHNYIDKDLKIQQRTFLCVVSSKTFYDRSDCGQDSSVRYEAIVLGEGTPEDFDLRLDLRNNKQRRFLSGEAVGYCGTSTRNFIHIIDIEYHRYFHIGTMCEHRRCESDKA